MIDGTMAALGILGGIFASIMWQEHVAPWIRKRRAYRQRVRSRKLKAAKQPDKSQGASNENP